MISKTSQHYADTGFCKKNKIGFVICVKLKIKGPNLIVRQKMRGFALLFYYLFNAYF